MQLNLVRSFFVKHRNTASMLGNEDGIEEQDEATSILVGVGEPPLGNWGSHRNTNTSQDAELGDGESLIASLKDVLFQLTIPLDTRIQATSDRSASNSHKSCNLGQSTEDRSWNNKDGGRSLNKREPITQTREFLIRCEEGVQYRLSVEQSASEPWLQWLDFVADEVRVFRLRAGESRREFAERFNVDLLDLMMVENGSASEEVVSEVIRATARMGRKDLLSLLDNKPLSSLTPSSPPTA